MQHCWVLPVASVSSPRCKSLCVVGSCCTNFETGQTSKPTTPNISTLFRDHWSVAQQCWIRLHSSSNIVGAMHSMEIAMVYYVENKMAAIFFRVSLQSRLGPYPSHNTLHVLTPLRIAASICTQLPTPSNICRIPKMLGVVESVHRA